MVTLVRTAKRLDWSGWALGICGAFISGGAGAIGAGFGAVVADPSHDFSIGSPGGTPHLLTLMGVTFLFSGAVSLAKFLQTHPVPEVGPNLLADDSK